MFEHNVGFNVDPFAAHVRRQKLERAERLTPETREQSSAGLDTDLHELEWTEDLQAIHAGAGAIKDGEPPSLASELAACHHNQPKA